MTPLGPMPLYTHRILPNLKCLHEVAAKAKEILHESVHCQKPLGWR